MEIPVSRGFLAAFLTATALLLSAVLPAHALVGDWISFTKVSEVRDLEAFEGSLWIATSGGIRKRSLVGDGETVFRNPEGLQDVSIQGLAATPGGDLWAAAESGLLYRLSRDRKRWDQFGMSYKSAGWRIRERALAYREPYLIVGSDKGLSFFHAGTGAADANITRMGTEKSVSVNAVHMEGDTLFVGTSKGIFRATLRLDRLLKDTETNIFNPEIWSRVAGTEAALYHHPWEGPPDTVAVVDTLAADTVELPSGASMDSAHGLLYHTPDGIASEFEGAAASDGSHLARYGYIYLDGEKHPNPFKMKALEKAGGRWFLGHLEGLFEYFPEWRGLTPLPSPEDLPLEDITMIRATSHGVYALGAPKLFKLNGARWDSLPGFDRHSDKVDANRNGSYPFHVLGRDEIYYGTWGSGFYVYSAGKGRTFGSGEGQTCLESAIEKAPTYSVVLSQAPLRGKGIFLATLHDGKPYKIAFYSFADDSLSCLAAETRDSYPLSLNIIEDMLVVVTEGGVASYRIRERDGRVTLDPGNLTPTLRSPEPTKSAIPDDFGNLWVTTGSGKMFFLAGLGDGQLTDLQFRSLEGFPGRECKSIDRDSRGHIWVGCVSGGVVEISPGRDSLAHSFRRYGLNDGLISENVYHLSVDSASGHVWVVTDRGVSRYESPSRPLPRTFASAKVYPNPFLARHGEVIFDGLASGAEIQILTQGGSVVYSRRLTALDGNQLRWDGRNLAGRKVREGVYFYTIRSPQDAKRGKLIVAR